MDSDLEEGEIKEGDGEDGGTSSLRIGRRARLKRKRSPDRGRVRKSRHESPTYKNRNRKSSSHSRNDDDHNHRRLPSLMRPQSQSSSNQKVRTLRIDRPTTTTVTARHVVQADTSSNFPVSSEPRIIISVNNEKKSSKNKEKQNGEMKENKSSSSRQGRKEKSKKCSNSPMTKRLPSSRIEKSTATKSSSPSVPIISTSCNNNSNNLISSFDDQMEDISDEISDEEDNRSIISLDIAPKSPPEIVTLDSSPESDADVGGGGEEEEDEEEDVEELQLRRIALQDLMLRLNNEKASSKGGRKEVEQNIRREDDDEPYSPFDDDEETTAKEFQSIDSLLDQVIMMETLSKSRNAQLASANGGSSVLKEQNLMESTQENGFGTTFKICDNSKENCSSRLPPPFGGQNFEPQQQQFSLSSAAASMHNGQVQNSLGHSHQMLFPEQLFMPHLMTRDVDMRLPMTNFITNSNNILTTHSSMGPPSVLPSVFLEQTNSNNNNNNITTSTAAAAPSSPFPLHQAHQSSFLVDPLSGLSPFLQSSTSANFFNPFNPINDFTSSMTNGGVAATATFPTTMNNVSTDQNNSTPLCPSSTFNLATMNMNSATSNFMDSVNQSMAQQLQWPPSTFPTNLSSFSPSLTISAGSSNDAQQQKQQQLVNFSGLPILSPMIDEPVPLPPPIPTETLPPPPLPSEKLPPPPSSPETLPTASLPAERVPTPPVENPTLIDSVPPPTESPLSPQSADNTFEDEEVLRAQLLLDISRKNKDAAPPLLLSEPKVPSTSSFTTTLSSSSSSAAATGTFTSSTYRSNRYLHNDLSAIPQRKTVMSPSLSSSSLSLHQYIKDNSPLKLKSIINSKSTNRQIIRVVNTSTSPTTTVTSFNNNILAASNLNPMHHTRGGTKYSIQRTIVNTNALKTNNHLRNTVINQNVTPLIIRIGRDESSSDEGDSNTAEKVRVERTVIQQQRKEHATIPTTTHTATPNSQLSSSSNSTLLSDNFERSLNNLLRTSREQTTTTTKTVTEPVIENPEIQVACQIEDIAGHESPQKVPSPPVTINHEVDTAKEREELYLREKLLKATLLQKMKDSKDRLILRKLERDIVTSRRCINQELTALLSDMVKISEIKALYKKEQENVNLLRKQLSAAVKKANSTAECLDVEENKRKALTSRVFTMRKECVQLVKECREQGYKIEGTNYKVPSAESLEMQSKLTEVRHQNVLLRRSVGKVSPKKVIGTANLYLNNKKYGVSSASATLAAANRVKKFFYSRKGKRVSLSGENSISNSKFKPSTPRQVRWQINRVQGKRGSESSGKAKKNLWLTKYGKSGAEENEGWTEDDQEVFLLPKMLFKDVMILLEEDKVPSRVTFTYESPLNSIREFREVRSRCVH